MDVDVPEEQPYMLREELHGHGAAVRSLCVSSTVKTTRMIALWRMVIPS